jgi:hypothetical protein
MPERVDRSEAGPPGDTGAVVPKEPPAGPGDAVAGGDPDRHVFDLSFSIGSSKPSLTDVLSPETIERLRSGGSLSDADLATLRSAFDRPEDVKVVVAPPRKFEWRWEGDKAARDRGTEPATYYEALSGRPDPMRGFFVTSRRLLDIVTWIVALGIPLGLVALGILTGESPETIFFMGFLGLFVGMLFKHSLPKTPFG